MKPSSKSKFCESPSSSSDDEGSRRDPPPQLKGIPCKNGRCDQELIFVNNSDYYCSRDCYYSKLELDERGGETGIEVKRVTINGRGGTGLLRDRSVLDHLRISVDPLFGRQVTIHNTGIDASRWKKKAGGKVSKKAGCDEAKRQKNEEEKRRLRALLNLGDESESSSSSDDEDDNDSDKSDDKKAFDEAHEEIRTMLSSGVNSSICPLHPEMGKRGTRLKGYIINIVSPWELYIKTEDMLIKTEEIQEVCNRPEGIDPRLVLPLWLPQVGGYCTAKYEDQLYRAKILESVDVETTKSFRVKYMDYGNIAVVPRSEVLQLDPELSLIPRQYFFFKISNVKPMNEGTKWDTEICKFLMEHLDGGIVEIEIESVERGIVHWGKLSVLSSLSGEVQGDFGKILVERKMADEDSFYLS